MLYDVFFIRERYTIIRLMSRRPSHFCQVTDTEKIEKIKEISADCRKIAFFIRRVMYTVISKVLNDVCFMEGAFIWKK